ncbi:secreted phosphoprotein 24 [Sinocyclocheilus anshuiensis]|uniref:secreted phosphoprotein 24 n=1 Tax=Sinocyclocheilus anshuiensis TaxID=1608454 RepID=UPI0007BAA4FB|nr:PREDICTED: secreted phosphoprotein 24 [Sinocyclocheilus anshuiensis]XP_016363638.1 PREDICTED: secreted phosphoprotein 24 [Sinocyclocheilus anshuiensis]XP_016363639.1 PREDICTED: secreted phosphoprotein 24 [Sinocyclocheilus anshuiensis]
MKMRCCVFLFLLLQVLGVLGFPLFKLSLKADDALQIALNRINARIATNHLYRVSKASVKRIVPLGMGTFDLHLRFGIRETECQKSSGVDPQSCMYRKGFFVSEAGCYIRARVNQDITRIISLRCTKADSSSSESSEEGGLGLYYDLNHFGTGDRTHSTSAPSINVVQPIHAGHHDNTETNHVRGDHFSNHLPYH